MPAADANFEIDGFTPKYTNIFLLPLWNLVGVLDDNTGIPPLFGTRNHIFSYGPTGYTTEPFDEENDATYLNKGLGYWVYTTHITELELDRNAPVEP